VSSVQISIIVATCNRHALLARLIDAMERLDYPKESIEVVVVDDGSDPPVRLPAAGVRVQVLRQPRGGPASARNAGIRAATGELIALLDDDCLPHADWLQRLSQAYLAHPKALIGGRTQNGLDANRYSTASQTLVDYLYERLGRTSSPNYFFTTSNIAGARAGFVAVGFDESFVLPAGEDRDLCDRWKVTGPLIYVARAVVDHCHDLSLTSFVRQQFGYGRGAKTLHRSRSRRGMVFCFEGLSFYGGLLAFPFRTAESHGPGAGIATCLLFLLAQTCNAAGYLLQTARGQSAHLDSTCRLTDHP
jgi:glycosyltransferase involved in cell wall biosynthesis